MCNYLSVSQLSHTPKTYLGPRQIYMMELISENNQGLLAGNYFHKKRPYQRCFLLFNDVCCAITQGRVVFLECQHSFLGIDLEIHC